MTELEVRIFRKKRGCKDAYKIAFKKRKGINISGVKRLKGGANERDYFSWRKRNKIISSSQWLASKQLLPVYDKPMDFLSIVCTL